MNQKLKVGILGATGMVGQRFISLLDALLGLAATVTTSNHGWFSNSEINLCPTIPVAPKIPTFN